MLITRSRAIDRLRNRKVMERTHEASHAAVPAEHASPEGAEAVLMRERRERVRREMESLPPEQRQVIEMAFYQGLTQSEIAAQADLPLAVVCRKSNRANRLAFRPAREPECRPHDRSHR